MTDNKPTQVCRICKRELPLNSVYWYRNKENKSGFLYMCKECTSDYQRKWHKENKERISRERKEKRDANRAKNGDVEYPHKTQVCTKCESEFPLTSTYWYRSYENQTGFYRHCKTCHDQVVDAWHERNPEYATQQYKQYYETHKEYVLEQNERWRRENKEYCAKLARQRYHLNIEGSREQSRRRQQRRRASLYNAPGNGLDSDGLSQKWRGQNGQCWHCGEPLDESDYHLDHLIPLSRGGTNESRNIVLSCPYCNDSKGDKLPSEWSGRLF